jgi:CRISPR-associated protein Csb3
MAEASIPVDLFNPGQVFACLGFMEAADTLLGDVEGGFDWSIRADPKFILRAAGEEHPFAAVLAFIAEAEPKRWGPIGYTDPPPKKNKRGEEEDIDEAGELDETPPVGTGEALDLSVVFPARQGDRMTLPIRFGGGNRPTVDLDHWTDESGRNSFKLYSGNRSADAIARAMLKGVHAKPTKKEKENGRPGKLKTKGIRQLWEESSKALIEAPFDVVTPMGGSFNFDPRGGWTAIDAGYSPNDHKHAIEASPIVELLAAWGLQNARPVEFDLRQVRYAVWGINLPPTLARVAFTGALSTVPSRHFHFELRLSGKNKVVTFAQESHG